MKWWWLASAACAAGSLVASLIAEGAHVANLVPRLNWLMAACGAYELSKVLRDA